MVDRFSLSKGLLFEQKILGRNNRIRGPRSNFFAMKYAIFLKWCYSLMVGFTGRQGTLFANTYPNVQNYHEIPGGFFLFSNFHFSLLSHVCYSVALQPVRGKPNSRKSMVFNIFSLIKKLSKISKFISSTLVKCANIRQ